MSPFRNPSGSDDCDRLLVNRLDPEVDAFLFASVPMATEGELVSLRSSTDLTRDQPTGVDAVRRIYEVSNPSDN
jgi:hypothetical protein